MVEQRPEDERRLAIKEQPGARRLVVHRADQATSSPQEPSALLQQRQDADQATPLSHEEGHERALTPKALEPGTDPFPREKEPAFGSVLGKTPPLVGITFESTGFGDLLHSETWD